MLRRLVVFRKLYDRVSPAGGAEKGSTSRTPVTWGAMAMQAELLMEHQRACKSTLNLPDRINAQTEEEPLGMRELLRDVKVDSTGRAVAVREARDTPPVAVGCAPSAEGIGR